MSKPATAKKSAAKAPAKSRSEGVIYVRGAGDLAKRLDEWRDELNAKGRGRWTREMVVLAVLRKALDGREPGAEP